MNELLNVTGVILVLTLNLIPFFIVISTLFPARTAITVEIAARSSGRAFIIGMVNFLFFLMIAMALFSFAGRLSSSCRPSSLRSSCPLPCASAW